MVQWFKAFIRHLVGFFKGWRPALRRDVIHFNVELLGKEIAQYADSLYELRREQSWQILREIIVRARNVQLLEVNRVVTNDRAAVTLAHHQGRMQAFTDMLARIDSAMDQAAYNERVKASQQQVRGERKITRNRRPGNSAGAAM